MYGSSNDQGKNASRDLPMVSSVAGIYKRGTTYVDQVEEGQFADHGSYVMKIEGLRWEEDSERGVPGSHAPKYLHSCMPLEKMGKECAVTEPPTLRLLLNIPDGMVSDSHDVANST